MSKHDGIGCEIGSVGLIVSGYLDGYHMVLDGWCLHQWHAHAEKFHVLHGGRQQVIVDKDVCTIMRLCQGHLGYD